MASHTPFLRKNYPELIRTAVSLSFRRRTRLSSRPGLTRRLLGALLLLRPGLTLGRWLRLLLVVCLPAQAQGIYQRQLRTTKFDYRYWAAPHDSLRRVLAGQRTDTLRLQTLLHLFDTTNTFQNADPVIAREHWEALATLNGCPCA